MEMFITIMGHMLVFFAIFLIVVVGAALVGIPKKAKAPANGNAFLFDHIYFMSLMVSGVVFMTRLFFGVGFALCAVIGFVFGLVVERVLWLVVPSRTANRWIAKSLADSKKLKSSPKASTQQPKCSLCRRTSDMVAADAKKKNPGVFVVGNLVGVCPECRQAFCTDHAPYDHGVDGIVCPIHKQELDIYWDNPPTEEQPWRIGSTPERAINKDVGA